MAGVYRKGIGRGRIGAVEEVLPASLGDVCDVWPTEGFRGL
jgi:hypothetical protein